MTVGAGGAFIPCCTTNTPGFSGGSSQFGAYPAAPGGGGGRASAGVGGTSLGLTSNGGVPNCATPCRGGGGAGASGAAGASYTGGAGVAHDITGSTVYYGGGGGAGSWNGAALISGGIGGGGAGGYKNISGVSGTNGLGGGGGGNGNANANNNALSGAGGSGVVILRCLASGALSPQPAAFRLSLPEYAGPGSSSLLLSPSVTSGILGASGTAADFTMTTLANPSSIPAAGSNATLLVRPAARAPPREALSCCVRRQQVPALAFHHGWWPGHRMPCAPSVLLCPPRRLSRSAAQARPSRSARGRPRAPSS